MMKFLKREILYCSLITLTINCSFLFSCNNNNEFDNNISIILYPLPNKERFVNIILEEWNKNHSNIKLDISFPDDPYGNVSYENYDLFLYDSMLIDVVKERNCIQSISKNEFNNIEDIYPFIVDGIKEENDNYYGIPLTLCSYCLLYEPKEDTPDDFNNFIEASNYFLSKEDNQSMIIDFSKFISFHYLNVLYSIEGKNAKIDLENINPNVLEILYMMNLLEKKYLKGLEKIPSENEQMELFNNGYGTGFFKFSETIKLLNKRRNLKIKFFSFQNKDEPHAYYADMISLNKKVTNQRKKDLCIELMNLICSSTVYNKYVFNNNEYNGILSPSYVVMNEMKNKDSYYQEVTTLINSNDNFLIRPGKETTYVINEGKEILLKKILEA